MHRLCYKCNSGPHLMLCIEMGPQITVVLLHSNGDADGSSKRQRKKMKKFSTERRASTNDMDNEQIESEIRQQIENVHVPTELPDKAVCIHIHTGSVSN